MLNKILKGIIAFVLLSMLYGVYVGLTNKSDEIVTETEINAPVEVIYDYVVDLEKSKKWLTDLKSIEKTSGEDGAVGSKYVLVFASGKNDIIMSETITAVEENERFAFDLNNEFITGTVDIRFTASGDGTLVTEVNSYSGNHFMARAMTGLFRGSFKKAKREMYDNLKEVAESAAN